MFQYWQDLPDRCKVELLEVCHSVCKHEVPYLCSALLVIPAEILKQFIMRVKTNFGTLRINQSQHGFDEVVALSIVEEGV